MPFTLRYAWRYSTSFQGVYKHDCFKEKDILSFGKNSFPQTEQQENAHAAVVC